MLNLYAVPRRLFWVVLVAIAVLCSTQGARGHIRLDAPNGGELLAGDSTTTIQWTITISHEFQEWNIWYSANGPAGPWVSIDSGLAAGNISVGAIHSYEWTVPAGINTTLGRIWVLGDAGGLVYDDTSDADFTIMSPCPIETPGDVNLSGLLTSADIIYMVIHVFKGGPIPEPCEANGDVNCSGSNTSGDIISMVSHIFKGGTPPCDICNEPTTLPCE
jgi:hypothetical protein